MLKYTGVLFLFAWAFIAESQILTLRDAVSLEALEQVVISSSQKNLSLSSDEKGKVNISVFKDLDSLRIRLIGYNTLIRSYSELEDMGFILHIQPDVFAMETTVISASRFEEDKRETPHKLSSLKSREVALQNPQTAADMLSITGDVYIQKSQQGGGSPMIRGFATNRVLLVIDGVRMNNAIFRSGNIQNVISLDPFTISSTEVLFGPGSILYGSDAIGGVMNFYTQKPLLSTSDKTIVRANAVTRYASANSEKTGHFDFNLGFKKWSFLSSATYSDYGDLRMGLRGPDDYLRPEYAVRIEGKDTLLSNPDSRVQKPGGYKQVNLMQKIRFKPTKNLDITYGVHYSETSDFSRYDRLIRPRGNGLRSAEWEYGPQIWAMNQISVLSTYKTAAFDQMRVIIAHQYFQESRLERDFNQPNRSKGKEELEAWSVNIDFEKKLHVKHTLHYGLEYVFNKVGSEASVQDIISGIRKPAASRYPDGADWRSYAAYSQYKCKVSEKFTLQTGVRYNHYSLYAVFDTTFYSFPFREANISRGALTGSGGFVYVPEKSWLVSFHTSTGFRAPNVDDIGKVFDSSPGFVVVPNPNLHSEYVYSAELGLAKVIKSRFKLDITGFYTYLDNVMVRRDFTLNGNDSLVYNGNLSRVQAIQNASYAEVQGIQAGMEIKLPKGLSLASRFNYMQGFEELDNGKRAPLRHVTPWFGTSRLMYARKQMRADFYVQYSGEVKSENLPPEEIGKEYLYAKDEAGLPFVPTWATLNFKLMYQFNRYVSLTGGIENITDVRYRPYTSGIAAPGRNIILALRAYL